MRGQNDIWNVALLVLSFHLMQFSTFIWLAFLTICIGSKKPLWNPVVDLNKRARGYCVRDNLLETTWRRNLERNWIKYKNNLWVTVGIRILNNYTSKTAYCKGKVVYVERDVPYEHYCLYDYSSSSQVLLEIRFWKWSDLTKVFFFFYPFKLIVHKPHGLNIY